MSELITVRRSEIETFRQCPLKHKLSWLDQWRKPEDSDASELGTLWHLVLADHYTSIKACREAGRGRYIQHDPELVANGILKLIDLRWIDTPFWERLRWMYTGYIEFWGVDPHWEIVAIEQTQIVRLQWADGAPSRFQLEWTSDIVVRDLELARNPLVVVDTKSTRQPLGRTDIDLSDQYGIYTLAERRVGRPVLMQVCNQVKTDKLKRPMTLAERFVRLPGFRTDRELVNIEQDFLDTAEAIYSERNLSRPYSSPDPRTCGWRCEFEQAHLALRKGALGFDRLPTLMRAQGFVQKPAPSGANIDQ